jgi:hypothetical protein
MPYEKAIELLLEIILTVVKNQPPDVAEKLWRRHIDLLEKWDGNWDALLAKLAAIKPES